MIVLGIYLHAITCPACGCRLYPAKSLPDHLDRHRLLDFQAFGNGQGWNNGRSPHTRKGNFKGRPKLKASEKLDSVNIKITEVGPR